MKLRNLKQTLLDSINGEKKIQNLEVDHGLILIMVK